MAAFSLEVCAQARQPSTTDQKQESSCGPLATAPGVIPPRATYTPDPEYTAEARRNHVEGVVVVQAVICPDGKAHDISVRRSPGYGLNDVAVEALGKWRFKPGTKDAAAVPVRVFLEVKFR